MARELETFREARKGIREWFGLELTTIELWHLRQYARDAVEQQSINRPENIYNIYNPTVETMSRFMSAFYNVRGVYIPEDNLLLWSIHCSDEQVIEGFKQYMRRLQAERHMP